MQRERSRFYSGASLSWAWDMPSLKLVKLVKFSQRLTIARRIRSTIVLITTVILVEVLQELSRVFPLYRCHISCRLIENDAMKGKTVAYLDKFNHKLVKYYLGTITSANASKSTSKFFYFPRFEMCCSKIKKHILPVVVSPSG